MDRDTAIARKLIVDFITTQRQPKTFIKATNMMPIPVGAFAFKNPADNTDKILFSDSESIMFCNFSLLKQMANKYNINLIRSDKIFIFETTESTISLQVV